MYQGVGPQYYPYPLVQGTNFVLSHFHSTHMMPRCGTVRSWCFTVNNPEPADENQIKDLQGTKYHVFGREVAESGTPHLQGFVQFSSAKSFKAVQKLLPPGTHIEPTKGRPDQAADYCKKDGDFWECGLPPTTPQQQGDTERDRYKRAWDNAVAGNLDEIPADILVRHYNTLKRIKADHQKLPPSQAVLDFWWFYGPSGSGKSLSARTENPDHYIKNINKWWDGYTGQPCVIIEEWNPSVVDGLKQMLKSWCDHHPFSAETKGSTTALRPPRIIVTSNYTLEECFGGDQAGLFEPLSRRMQVRCFPEYPIVP